MRRIIYYVASAIDGYISGLNDDISGFVQRGNGVEKYLQDLQTFDTVLMGRKTYEFGYQYGLKPGDPAYPHMDHYIFSQQLSFEQKNEKVQVCELDKNLIMQLKAKTGSDIYLCGGGALAAWLLEQELIDVLKVKLNPLVLGAGVKLFAQTNKAYHLDLMEQESFEEGLQIITYSIRY